MDCSLQNNLVTFNGQSQKRALPNVVAPFDHLQRLDRRQDSSSSNSGTTATSNGIIYASGTPTPTATTSSPSASSTGSTKDSKTLDFARVAVLYVFQASQELTVAADAQENLQAYLRNGFLSSSTSASAITLGNGYTADLTSYSISISNGTIFGGTGSNDSNA